MSAAPRGDKYKRFGKIACDFAKPFFYMDLCRRGG